MDKSEIKKNYKLRVRGTLKAKVLEYLATHPCQDCGEPDPIVLEFDHRDQSAKVDSVARLVNDCKSWETVLEEIQKCDVRCANCHKRRTAKQLGFWKQLG